MTLSIKNAIALFSIAAFLVSMLVAVPAHAQTTPLGQVKSGDLIRGETFSAVYYMGEDGFRYVFPNDKTYNTWYSNFNSVIWLTDADLAKIQIGGNVTYRPGVRMIKINSDPKTYAVGEGGTLMWVTSESAAVALYGSAWNTMIDDVPDAFFSNYSVSGEINSAGDFSPSEQTANAENINDDKSLQGPIVIDISDNAYSNTNLTIERGRVVKFVNKGANKHTATADDLKWGTGTLNGGDSFSRYFKDAGTFTYFCSYHPSTMTGSITVE